MVTPVQRKIDSQIVKLALPSLATLLIEPLLISIDSTMIGRLGTTPLAGLALASTILTTIIGLCIFLSFVTTSNTAQAVGGGKTEKALKIGIDVIWISLGLGIIFAILFLFFSRNLFILFNPTIPVLNEAVAYAQTSALGIPGMLLVLSTTGTLRGFSNTKTPLFVSLLGAFLNIPLNFALIYLCHLGISGAGLGTAITQTLMGTYLTYKIFTKARAKTLSLKPKPSGIKTSLKSALPLIVRTLSLRGAILLQITTATTLGTIALASNQIVMTTWNITAYGLDALAIASQILIGQSIGKGNENEVKNVLRRCLFWGIRIGIILAVIFFASSFIVPILMSTNPDIHLLSKRVMWLTAFALPISTIAFIGDGILMGANDMQKLAKYMFFALLSFSPISIFLIMHPLTPTVGMLLLWFGYAVIFTGVRAGTILWRIRTNTLWHTIKPQIKNT